MNELFRVQREVTIVTRPRVGSFVQLRIVHGETQSCSGGSTKRDEEQQGNWRRTALLKVSTASAEVIASLCRSSDDELSAFPRRNDDYRESSTAPNEASLLPLMTIFHGRCWDIGDANRSWPVSPYTVLYDRRGKKEEKGEEKDGQADGHGAKGACLRHRLYDFFFEMSTRIIGDPSNR